MTPKGKILVATGEPSGDLHGAKVVRALLERCPTLEIAAIGGPRLEAAGATIRHPIDQLGAFGLVEVLHQIPTHLKLLRSLQSDFRKHRYDLVITVDYPGFNLKVAQSARNSGIPVLGYIAPQLWAWHPGRARKWARAVDRLAVILPFEPEFFAGHGIDATHVGHPLVDDLPDSPPTRSAARLQLGIDPDARVLALFPGSRPGEISRLWPVYRDAARQLVDRAVADHIVVAGTTDGVYPELGNCQLVRDQSLLCLAAADAALVKSGTTTLQAAIADVPMVVAYRINQLSYLLLRRLVTVPWVSLVNLIAEQEVVPELVQHRVEPDSLVAAVAPLLDRESNESRRQHQGLARVRSLLGGPGAAERVATMALELIQR